MDRLKRDIAGLIFWILVFVAIATYCYNGSGCNQTSNEQLTLEWIKKSPKPITALQYGSNDFGTKWTLIDSAGNVFQTGFVFLKFPPKIQVECK